MDDSDFNQLIKAVARRSPAPLPGSFGQDVLREIRLREDRHGGWLQEICHLFLHPRLLAGSTAVVLAVALVFPAMISRAAEPTRAADHLGLGVFSVSSSNLPSGLLAKAR